MISYVKYWALAGLLIPVVIWLIAQLQGGVFRAPYLMLLLWPSSIMLMALEAVHKRWWDPILVYGVSLGVNILLYSAVGTVVWVLRRFFSQFLK